MRCSWRKTSCLFAGMVSLSIAVCAAAEKTAANDFRLLDGFESAGEWRAGATEDPDDLYTIDPAGGAATRTGSTGVPGRPSDHGPSIPFVPTITHLRIASASFSRTVDRIRKADESRGEDCVGRVG